ncbi:SprT family zinc-dependent metalloprotease [Ramlibacter tataouinensis]|uniref:M48 family metallopeptidase n=1 Tax=Ramlibacter tataouinensis TaxID=94132 RepID=UPI0022F3DC5C|nr:SprT family zinc-dependent metalloprotease [Ramlibacter tataouinensis]WBY00435.1 SprT family zinc-dependent metalloprotease [Ramlibacter tataouinensis]
MLKFLQLTLDFLDPAPAASAPAKPAVQPAPLPEPEPAAPPAEPLAAVLAPATFHHPRANRQATLGGTFVAYEFRRRRRRSIGFVVGAEGLTVSAPNWVPLREVDAAVQEKSGWILAKLQAARQRQDKLESARIEWKDGASFPFLGEPVIVVLDPRRGTGAVLNTDAQALPGVPRLTLHVGLPQDAAPEKIRDVVQAWLMRQARRLFTERLDHFAPLLAVQWRKLALSNAGTRWGTAHSDGTIRLNWRLVHFRLPVIDYVVAHELSHLRVMDHSPRFWDTVATVVPDYAQLRGQLKDEAIPGW